MTGLAPADNGFFNKPGLGVVLGEELGLSVHQLGGMGFERFGDPGMELLPRATQQRAVGGLKHQRVLEQVLGSRRHSALKDQAGIEAGAERGREIAASVPSTGLGVPATLQASLMARLATADITHRKASP